MVNLLLIITQACFEVCLSSDFITVRLTSYTNKPYTNKITKLTIQKMH